MNNLGMNKIGKSREKLNKSRVKLIGIESITDQIEEQILTQNQENDTKYKNIIYCMANRNKSVYYSQHALIDFVKASNELNDLDWTYTKNAISFINLKNDGNIFGHRIEKNKWHVISPVRENGEYHGFEWSSHADHESILHIVRLFFDEVPWLETLKWNKIKWKSDFNK